MVGPKTEIEFPTLYIVGMPGSGKTTFSRKIAKNLKWKFIDLDRLIEEKEGKSISSLFKRLGENGFRELERLHLHSLQGLANTVIATGGGTPVFFDNIHYMNTLGITLFLDCKLDVLIQRNTQNKKKRPLLKDLTELELADKLSKLLELRRPYYEQSHLYLIENGIIHVSQNAEYQIDVNFLLTLQKCVDC